MSVDGDGLRLGTSHDVAALHRLEAEIAEAPHWSEAEYQRVVTASAQQGAYHCVVWQQGQSPAGFAVGHVVEVAGVRTGTLESVVVAAALRRQGVGRALCQAVLAWCRRQGADAVELEVRAGSQGAIALYRSLGFVAEGVRRGYYRAPVEDALLMRLTLRERVPEESSGTRPAAGG
ncbi:MAG: GNAT family N-acetyltransferase [Acidobacteriota bacterium]|nr:GNAT family N-acetyltransferase [Acidobacteriota bacterium]